MADSSSVGPLTASTTPYSYTAHYNGDSNYNEADASNVEQVWVDKADITFNTTIKNANGDAVTGTHVPLATIVHDTAAFGAHVDGILPTGTVTYDFSTTAPEDKAITAGLVADSSSVGPLTASTTPYSYTAHYNGDSNYNEADASNVEQVWVDKADITFNTTIKNANGDAVTGTHVPLATIVHDTAAFGAHVDGILPTGTVTYDFSTTAPEDKAITAGLVADSSSVGPLTASTTPYSYTAHYNGDSNYNEV